MIHCMESMTPVPHELLLDENNPANDPYFRNLEALRAVAVSYSRRMRARHVRIVQMAHQGRANKDIAEELKITQGTVSRILHRDDAIRLRETLQHIGQLLDGPSLELRANMLWRIARTNEDPEPAITIQAVKELNKMSGAYPVQAQAVTPNINIVINDQAMPRTALDGEVE